MTRDIEVDKQMAAKLRKQKTAVDEAATALGKVLVVFDNPPSIVTDCQTELMKMSQRIEDRLKTHPQN
jgi:hypothetical protein